MKEPTGQLKILENRAKFCRVLMNLARFRRTVTIRWTSKHNHACASDTKNNRSVVIRSIPGVFGAILLMVAMIIPTQNSFAEAARRAFDGQLRRRA